MPGNYPEENKQHSEHNESLKSRMFIHVICFRYFDCIDICKVRSGWNEVRLRGTLPPLSSLDHLSCVLLTVLEPTEAEFTLFQEGQR